MSAEPMLDEIEAAARALDTARQAYGAAMMRAFVHVENERYEATRKVADMSHTIMLRDETIATLTRERDEARADAERYLADLRRCASEPYEHAKERAEAFRRGAEAMREACARMEPYAYNLDDHLMISKWRSLVRGLPIPEEP